jgi:hypothetical protein
MKNTNISANFTTIQSASADNHISEVFHVEKILGSGAYGNILRVTEKKSLQTYAMKVSKRNDRGLMLQKEALIHETMSEYQHFPGYHGLR